MLALSLAPATGEKHHATINSALKAAMRAGLIGRNVATLASNKPSAPEGHADVLANVWEAHEARQFLAAAKARGPQPAAFYALALETGMRKAELCGLQWPDLTTSGRLTVQRQLVKPGSDPILARSRTRRLGRWKWPRAPSICFAPTDAIRPRSSFSIASTITTTGYSSPRSGPT